MFALFKHLSVGSPNWNLFISGAINEKFCPAVSNTIFGAGLPSKTKSFWDVENICLFFFGVSSFLSEINSKSLTPEEIANFFFSSSSFFFNSSSLYFFNLFAILCLFLISSHISFQWLNFSLNKSLSRISFNLSKKSFLASSINLLLLFLITSSTLSTKSIVFKSLKACLFILSSINKLSHSAASAISLFFLNLSKTSFLCLSSIFFFASDNALFNSWDLINWSKNFFWAANFLNSLALSFNRSSKVLVAFFKVFKVSRFISLILFLNISFNFFAKSSKFFFLFFVSFFHLSKHFL